MKTVYLNISEEINKRKSKKIAKKLYRLSRKEDIIIAMSKKLIENQELNAFINNFGLRVLNGKWLFKFLLFEIIEYISKIEHKILETQNIAVILERQDDIVIGQLLEIAKKVKSIKIISNYINDFKFLEEKLYIDYGIAMQITNNKKKSLSNVDIVINIDYDEKKLNEYNINNSAVLVNIQENIDLKRFSGVNINDYKIEFNKEHFNLFGNEEDYENNIIYESYIYRRDTLTNIQNQLKQDDVRIIGLIQNNGKYYSEKVLDKPKILA